jgi:dihydropteroate synthase
MKIPQLHSTYPSLPKLTWGHHSVDLSARPVLMGILNITDDSFYDGGAFFDPSRAIDRAIAMEAEGAGVIDMGGQSTRPGYVEISEAEEMERVIPLIKALKKIIRIPLSIDTYKPAVALAALEAGVDMLNDIWGFQRHPEMAQLAAQFRVPAVLMHNRSTVDADIDIVEDIKQFFENSLGISERAGIPRERIILDPGIGFGKTQPQNLEILKRLHELNGFGCPLLVGASRKSVIGHVLGLPVSERLEGTLAISIHAALHGVCFLRVHDIVPNLRVLQMHQAISKGLLYG